MKCVCGYEHEEEYSIEALIDITIKGDDPFVVLKTIDHENPIVYQDTKRYEPQKFQLLMCPKCGTIRGERYFG